MYIQGETLINLSYLILSTCYSILLKNDKIHTKFNVLIDKTLLIPAVLYIKWQNL